jgi:hypothetical protein
MATRLRVVWPAILAVCVAATYAGWRLSLAGWDPIGLADVGTRYSQGSTRGTEGYDGQFALAIALDPTPATVATHLDVPAYRYQRIVYPLMARALGLGSPAAIPWALLFINLIAQGLGTWFLAKIFQESGERPGYAVVYALWVGLVASAGLDLNEPVAFALIAAGWLALRRGRLGWAALWLTVSLFTKETGLLFWIAGFAGAWLATGGRKRRLIPWIVAACAYAGWQAWLWTAFGSPGLVSGGAMATSFEWIPFMGLLRVGAVSGAVLALYLVIFGPTIVLPAIWGLWSWLRDTFRRSYSAEGWALAASAAMIAFLPFSTFREPLGLLRVASGLVVAVLLYASKDHRRRALNYALLWSAFLVVLLKP